MSTPCVSVNDVVLIRDKNIPRNHWPMGRVSAIFPSPDGLVRNVALCISPLPGQKQCRSIIRGITDLVLLIPSQSHGCKNALPRESIPGECRSLRPLNTAFYCGVALQEVRLVGLEWHFRDRDFFYNLVFFFVYSHMDIWMQEMVWYSDGVWPIGQCYFLTYSHQFLHLFYL